MSRIAVIFGGRSSEHAISCISARSVLAAIPTSKHEVRAVGIRPDGAWVSMPVDPADWSIDAESGLPRVGRDEVSASTLPGDLLDGIEVAFPVLHGPWGEDGTIQGLLETAGIPYVGSGVLASAVAMDKGYMKALLAAAGLPVGPWVMLAANDDLDVATEAVSDLGSPVFVKPARAGSSVGITRVRQREDLAAAVDVARAFDPRVIIEAEISPAREIECGVISSADGRPQASDCAEIRVRAGHDFYDFEAKYLDDSADLVVPAELDPHVRQRVRDLSCAAFTALGCEGLARVDFFVPAAGPLEAVLDGIVINEVNTMPGFTPISMFPRMWQASGMSYEELVEHLIADALRRGTGLR